MGDIRLLQEGIILAQPSYLMQKCDAKRPCVTCVLSKCALECTYDDEKHPQAAGTRPLYDTGSHSLEGQPGGVDPVDVCLVASADPLSDGVLADLSSAAKLELIPPLRLYVTSHR